MLKNKRFRRVVIILLIIALIIGLITIRPTSADSEPSLSNESVELDNVSDGEVTISFIAPRTGSWVSFGGEWSLTDTTSSGEEKAETYFTLIADDATENDGVRSDWCQQHEYLSETHVNTNRKGLATWTALVVNNNTQGIKVDTVGQAIWTATYKIAENTPEGDYYIAFSDFAADIYDDGNNYSYYELTTPLIAKITVTRAKIVISDPQVTIEDGPFTYTGNQITPEITVKNDDETVTLVKDTDYTVSYGENKNVVTGGSITITPVATSDYTFTEKTVNFAIGQAESQFDPSLLVDYADYLRQSAGTKLGEITLGGMPVAYIGITWANPEQEVQEGNNVCVATYQQGMTDGTAANYSPKENVIIPIYGLHTININASVDGGHGSISPVGLIEDIEEDSEIEFTLTPDADYKVDALNVNNTPVTVTNNKATVKAGPSDMTVVATFKEQREDLTISGIGDNQEFVYNREKVTLAGNLSVSSNEDNITVSDLTTTWYKYNSETGEYDEIGTGSDNAPANAGTYKVVYSYYGDNYKGSLVVNFVIDKADSVLPEGALEMIAERLKIAKGTELSELDVTPYGATWVDDTITVEAGSHSYPALYVTNGDLNNYNIANVNIPVYGLNYITITTSVSGEHGTISDSLTDVLEGTSQTITLTPDDLYKVKEVKVDGETATVTDNTVTFRAKATDMTVVATFKLIQDPLTLSGIENNQEITYTGNKVELEGTIEIGENTDNITASDITATYYEYVTEGELGELVELDEAPTNVGSYQVVYSYDGANYKGELTVDFEIVKADSVLPSGVLEAVAENLKVPALVTTLADLPIESYSTLIGGSASWDEPTTVVAKGLNNYTATYLTNNDDNNYNSTTINVPVYGLSYINITTSVDGEHGTITESFENVLEGTEKTIEVIPNDGYQIKELTVDGETVTVASNKATITAGSKDMEVVAKFEKIPFEYEYIEGAGQTYTKGTDGTATFKIDAEYSLVDKVYVDEKLVDSSNYTLKSGSTIVTFTKDFMNSLAVGTHTLKVTYTDNGVAATTFIVKAAETTTDNAEEKTDPATTTTTETTTTETVAEPTSSTPKTGDKVLIDIYIAIVSGLAVFMIIDHKLNSKPRPSTRRRK